MSRYREVVQTALAAGSLSLLLTVDPATSRAEDLTAADLMRTMSDQEQYIYISGVITGLATARYVQDGNDTGSACIDRWFYDTKGVREKIYAAFARFGDRAPSAILYAMAAKECGK